MYKIQLVKLLLIFIGLFILASASYMYFNISHDIDSLNIYNSDVGIPPKTNIHRQEEPQAGSGQTIASGIDTSDWKLYRNEEYGFEVKYPKDWLLNYKRFTTSTEIAALTSPHTKDLIDWTFKDSAFVEGPLSDIRFYVYEEGSVDVFL